MTEMDGRSSGPHRYPSVKLACCGSVKCTLRSKAVPHGVSALRRKCAEPHRSSRLLGAPEGQHLRGQLRRVEQQTNGKSLPQSPSGPKQMSAKARGATLRNEISSDTVRNACADPVSSMALQVPTGGDATNCSAKSSAIATKPKIRSKPKMRVAKVSVVSPDASHPASSSSSSSSSLLTSAVAFAPRKSHGRQPNKLRDLPSGTLTPVVLPSRTKTNALTAMFEGAMTPTPPARPPKKSAAVTKVTYLQGGGFVPTLFTAPRSPGQEAVCIATVEDKENLDGSTGTCLIADAAKTKNKMRICIDSEDVPSNPSNRSSDSSAYDDVLVSGLSDGEGGTERVHVHVRDTQVVHDIQDGGVDSGRGSTISTDGENTLSDWVDETSPTQATPRPRGRHSRRRRSPDASRQGARREGTTRRRFRLDLERTLLVTSRPHSDYDDVVVPQGDENDWETESEASDLDPRLMTDSGMALHNEADVGGVTPHPTAPPRSVSTPRPLPGRQPEPATAALQKSPHGSPSTSHISPARASRRGSPVHSLAAKYRSDSFRRQKREGGLKTTIPPPSQGLISRSRTSSLQSECSGGSLFEETGADGGPAPPMLPRRQTPVPTSARHPLPTETETLAPPLPPRDSNEGSLPPPTPPRQKDRPLPTGALSPDTVVPLSPKPGESPPPRPPKMPPPTTPRPSMLVEVPPAPRDKRSPDDYVGPDPPLQKAPPPPQGGYLAMGDMASAPRRTELGNYIDPRDIDSWPGSPGASSRQSPEPFRGLWSRKGSESENQNYLTILPDETPPDLPVRQPAPHRTSNRFVDEPLYQIYHFGAVAQDVLDQHREDDSTDDDSYSRSGDQVEVSESDKIYETWEKLTMSQTKQSVAEIRSTLQNVIRTSTGVRTLWCEMPEVQQSGITPRMTIDERKFQETLFEIITSEASYLKSLKLLMTHFMQSPLLTEDIVSKHDKHILFSNLVAVYNVSERFLNELELRWQDNFILQPGLCSLISKYAASEFQVYITYCSNLTYQERKLKKLRNDSPIFREVLRQLERSSLCHGLPMQSFITMPMQRITRFPLLIDAVCKRMPTNCEEGGQVTNALLTFQKLVRRCNEGARQLANLEEMADIDKKLKFKHLKKMAIVSKGRFPVKKGLLTHLLKTTSGLRFKKTEQLYLFLFNDILIITKHKGEDNYQVLDYAARINCHAMMVTRQHLTRALPHPAPANCDNTILMTLLENHEKKPAEFYFTCESATEQLRWVEAVTPAQQVNDDERIYEPWACPQVQTIHRYVAAEPDELSLEDADIINVSRKMADGWYEGERMRDGERGWFPANHTMEIQNKRARASNMLQRYRLLALHDVTGSGGHSGVMTRLESSVLSSV